jgi:hypothetical protein
MPNLENRNRVVMSTSFTLFLLGLISAPIGMFLESQIIVYISITLLGVFLMVPGIFLLFKPDISFYWFQGLKPWIPAYRWEKVTAVERAFLYFGSVVSFIFGILLILAMVFKF